MVEEPLEAAVATPVPASIVTKPLSDDHAPPASPPELLMVTTELGFKAVEPLHASVPAFGVAEIVKETLLVYCSEPSTLAVAHLEAPLLNIVAVDMGAGLLDVAVLPPAVTQELPPSVLFSHK